MSVIRVNQPYASDGLNAVILNITYDEPRIEPDMKRIKKLAKKFNLTTFKDGWEHTVRFPANLDRTGMTPIELLGHSQIVSSRIYYYNVSEKIFNYAKVKVCISQPKGCEWAFLTHDGNCEFNDLTAYGSLDEEERERLWGAERR
tara:strand:+ start:69 stop:503 length:435 start_codon:yes stop_codon:yes gene_type:complete